MIEFSLSHRPPMQWLALRLSLAAAAAALADWLFVDRAAVGLSLALFLGAIGLLTIVANPVRANMRLRSVAAAAFILALLAIMEDISWLSFLVATGATLMFAQVMTFGGGGVWPSQLRRACSLPFVGPFWLIGDVLRARRLSRSRRKTIRPVGTLVAWIAPVGLFLIFLSLFAAANPVIDEWVRLLDPRRGFELISTMRILFWMMIACLIWPLAHLRRPRKRPQRSSPASASQRDDGALLGADAVLRSLLLFNALFALQTSLDVAYLWGGLTLPHGLTYAAYAHHGAYPLLATAVLAAGFVLIAMRPGGPAERSRHIKPLVLIFVAQNFMLVLSSMFRTGLYVDAYSLSKLRLAALIWMGLVAVGLMLITIQIATKKTNKWLLDANALAAAATLYLCCFLNFPHLVATYNVTHCAETSGSGPALDVDYLLSLGPQAIPAYERYVRLYAERTGRRPPREEVFARSSTIADIDWRSWTFRGWRLKRYFDTNPQGATPTSDDASGK
ncbi:uncharacterized protein DUF4173 [Methylosinus sp. sav-2]|uniref:DUF4153 domain-containing protein n=1 Tax=Methylosinus sp. sav-2 TaxID=2485168 RepID=UPI00068BA711|nr:DUF4173 domain-containing protein [Methylosinus sp. sav-2]TDX66470.1 uncharacterized protein DUF4173 [Methylosinus sp. sav-2]